MTTNAYIGYDRRKQRQVARERIKKGAPLNLTQFLVSIEDERPRVRYVDLPAWVEGHGFNPDAFYTKEWWKDALKKAKKLSEN